jgi:hypothetical protein
MAVEVDELGFLRYSEGKRLIWLPAHLRGWSTGSARHGVIVVCGRTGAVTIVKLGCQDQNAML